MHEESIDIQTKSVLDKISGKDFLKPFYLAGGTALAIHFGHRMSIDLDFFTSEKFSVSGIKNELSKIGFFEVTSEDAAGTLNGILDGVSVSFFMYPYENTYPLVPFSGVSLADERDIAAMKIDAISSRGSRKDFTDIYFLLKKYQLSELLSFFETRFKNIHYNKLHILKSLSYFEDAEKDPSPLMLSEVSWLEIKRVILHEVKKIT